MGVPGRGSSRQHSAVPISSHRGPLWLSGLLLLEALPFQHLERPPNFRVVWALPAEVPEGLEMEQSHQSGHNGQILETVIQDPVMVVAPSADTVDKDPQALSAPMTSPLCCRVRYVWMPLGTKAPLIFHPAALQFLLQRHRVSQLPFLPSPPASMVPALLKGWLSIAGTQRVRRDIRPSQSSTIDGPR